MSISLDVSIGEAIDKLTILDIKCKKITDKRVIEVQKEYDYIYSQLKPILHKYFFYYDRLYDTNKMIWEKQDNIRYNSTEESRDILYKDIVDLNDSRFLIKNKINMITSSI